MSSILFRPPCITFHTLMCWAHRSKTSTMMIVLLLMLLEVIIPVTSRLNSVTVMSYMKGRKVLGGDVMCALDAAFETISSSSLQNCSYKCGRDATCIGFNIKNSLTCDIYTRKPAVTSPVSGCIFYQVGTVSIFLRWAYIEPRGPLCLVSL